MEKLDNTNPLVSADWLIAHMNSENVIVDCRWDLFDHKWGDTAYHEGHIPGAVHLNMEEDLSDLSIQGKGRHPMPGAQKFKVLMERSGISNSSTVICYDDKCSGASRLWFLLKYYGHDQVYILDGGMGAYLRAGGKSTTEIPEVRKGFFSPVIRNGMIAEMDEIRKGSANLVDSRAHDRYTGENTSIDRKAGHIPGASNCFYEYYIEDGRFKSKEELSEMLKNLGNNPVFYCGSGVTSCIPYVASVICGIDARIYPGSWSEWITRDDNEIALGSSPG